MCYKLLPKHERAKMMPAWRLRTNMSFLISNLQYYLQVFSLDLPTAFGNTCPDAFRPLCTLTQSLVEVGQWPLSH